MDISVIIVNWNAKGLLRDCLASVQKTLPPLVYEVIVVDNASSDGSAAMVRQEFPEVRIIENGVNRGFAAANNQAMSVMGGRYALLLNTDAVLTEGAVWTLFSFMERESRAAIACGQLLNADGSRQNSIAAFPDLLSLATNTSLLEYLWPQHYPSKRYAIDRPLEVDSAIGACMVVRREAVEAVGMFDERYFFFFEETDWAYRMRAAGWKIFHVPGAFIYHLQGQSIGNDIRSRIEFYRSRYQYFRKWRSRPYFMAVGSVIFLRLCVNWLLNSFAVVLTLGQKKSFRAKGKTCFQLLLWHLRGCPARQSGCG